MDTAQLENLTLGSMLQYPAKWPGADMATYPKKGYGLCDDEMWANRQGAEGWRSFKSLLPLDVVAATSIGFAAGAQMQWFGSKGQGQSEATLSGYPTTYVLTVSETDADREGGMVIDEDEQFFIFAMGFSVDKPIEMDATDGTAPVLTEPATWLERYDRRIQQQLSTMMGITINWVDIKCEYDLSLMKDWPVHSDTVTANTPASSNRTGFLGVNALRRPIIGGYRTSKDLITIKGTAGLGYSILNDAAFPIPAIAEDHSIVVPVTCKAYGVQQKKNRCQICVGGSMADLDAMIDERLKQLVGRK